VKLDYLFAESDRDERELYRRAVASGDPDLLYRVFKLRQRAGDSQELLEAIVDLLQAGRVDEEIIDEFVRSVDFGGDLLGRVLEFDLIRKLADQMLRAWIIPRIATTDWGGYSWNVRVHENIDHYWVGSDAMRVPGYAERSFGAHQVAARTESSGQWQAAGIRFFWYVRMDSKLFTPAHFPSSSSNYNSQAAESSDVDYDRLIIDLQNSLLGLPLRGHILTTGDGSTFEVHVPVTKYSLGRLAAMV
jgi:hypothetical protein